MHKSIFSQLAEYKSDPLTEYRKIDQLIAMKSGIYSESLSNVFEAIFSLTEGIRGYYVNYDDCIKRNTSQLSKNRNNTFANLPCETQCAVTEEFLKYCEIIAHLIAILCSPNNQSIVYSCNLDKGVYNQLVEMMHNSLHSIGYELVQEDAKTHTYSAIKINPEAESVAVQSPKGIRKLVYEYLGTRDEDEKTKERVLLDLINELGPALKSYNKNDENVAKRVKKVGEYLQLMRHPAENREKEKNSWFYGNKEHYLDDLFNLCIFVQNYELTKRTIEKFLSLEAGTTKENQSL